MVAVNSKIALHSPKKTNKLKYSTDFFHRAHIGFPLYYYHHHIINNNKVSFVAASSICSIVAFAVFCSSPVNSKSTNHLITFVDYLVINYSPILVAISFLGLQQGTFGLLVTYIVPTLKCASFSPIHIKEAPWLRMDKNTHNNLELNR